MPKPTPELFNSKQNKLATLLSGQYSASYRKIFGDEEMDSDSEDDSEHEMEDSDHELDGDPANDKDSDATPTGFRLLDVEL